LQNRLGLRFRETNVAKSCFTDRRIVGLYHSIHHRELTMRLCASAALWFALSPL